MTKELTVSVVIPVYNRPRELAEAIRSALDQTYQPMEILVGDDGSEQDIAGVVASFSDPRIKHIPFEHCGRAGHSRNMALAQATGDLIAFLDSDDIWFPEKLAGQASCFAKDPALVLLWANVRRFGNAEDEGRLYFANEHKFGPEPLVQLIRSNAVVTSTAVVRKSTIDDVGPFDEELKYFEDYELWLRVASKGRIQYEHAPLAHYRTSGKRLSNMDQLYHFLLRKRMIGDFRKWLSRTDLDGVFQKEIRRIQGIIARLYLKQGNIRLAFLSLLGKTEIARNA